MIAKIRKPSFNISAGNNVKRIGVLMISRWNTILSALCFLLLTAISNGARFGINDNNQICIFLLRMAFSSLGLFSDPLLSRTAAGRKRKSCDVTALKVPVLQEVAHERVSLLVLAEQNDLDATHLSHPRATISERASPSTTCSGFVLTRTGLMPPSL